MAHGMLRSLSLSAASRREIGLPHLPGCWNAHSMRGRYASARSTATLANAARPSARMRLRSVFEQRAIPNFLPLRFDAACVAFTRSEIIFRSCSARDAYMCSVKSSQSFPRAATIKCTRCSISPVMKWTLRDSRSSLETIIGHRTDLASLRAATSPGRNSRASAPAPVSTSWCQDLTAKPSRAPKDSMSDAVQLIPGRCGPVRECLPSSIRSLLTSWGPPSRWRHDMRLRDSCAVIRDRLRRDCMELEG